MNRFYQLLREVVGLSELDVEVKEKGSGLLVTFQNGRRQRLRVKRHRDHYLLTSVVLKANQVAAIGRAQILAHLWQRNRSTHFVAFSLDKRGQLIGRIEQLAETIDAAELLFYLETLAQECDQYEYLLTGRDGQ